MSFLEFPLKFHNLPICVTNENENILGKICALGGNAKAVVNMFSVHNSTGGIRTHTEFILSEPTLPLVYRAIVGLVGLEPTRSIDRQILSLLRIPIPPQSRTTPPRFELGKRDPKSPVIPFHHGVLKHITCECVHCYTTRGSYIQTPHTSILLNIQYVVTDVKDFCWKTDLFLTKC